MHYAGCGEISGDYGFGINCRLDLGSERAAGKVGRCILSFGAVHTQGYERGVRRGIY